MRTIKNLIGSIFISLAIFSFWFYILPNYEKHAYLKSLVQSRMNDFEKKNSLIQKVEELDTEYQSRYPELKRLSLVAPQDKHLEEMITIIEEMFSKNGISLNNISLGVQEDKGPFNTIGLVFDFKADYDSVLNFLNVIEKSLRLIDLSKMDIGIDKTNLDKNRVSLDVKLVANAYFVNQKEQSSAQTKEQSTENVGSAIPEE